MIVAFSSDTIMIPFNYDIKSFDGVNYTPSQTQGKLSSAEMEACLQEISKPYQDYREKHDDPNHPSGLVVLSAIFGCLVFPLVYVCCKMSAATKAWKDEMTPRMNKILKEQNARFESRGLRWIIPPQFPRILVMVQGEQQPMQNMPNMQNNYSQGYSMPQSQQPRYS